MKKKLVLLGPAHPYRGGIAAFNHQLAYTFQNNNWEVNIINFKYQYPSILFPGKNQYTDEAAPRGLSIDRKIHTINPLNWISNPKQIAKTNPDLVMAQYWMPQVGLSTGYYLKKIKQFSPKTQTANIIHNLLPHEQKIGDQFLIDYQMKAADKMIALSNAVEDDIINTKSDAKTIRLFHPIYNHYGPLIEKNKAKLDLELPSSNDYILFFGLVRKYKGLDLLIEAFAKIVDKLPNKKLLIVGEFYDDETAYRNQIEKLGLKEKVIIKNQYVASSEIPKYFCAADLVVLPYKTATQSGITQIGLYFEKPMIVTNVGGLHEVVKEGENGNLVNAEDAPIAQAMINFYSQDLEKQFSNGSKALKAKLSWDNFYIQLIKALGFEQ